MHKESQWAPLITSAILKSLLLCYCLCNSPAVCWGSKAGSVIELCHLFTNEWFNDISVLVQCQAAAIRKPLPTQTNLMDVNIACVLHEWRWWTGISQTVFSWRLVCLLLWFPCLSHSLPAFKFGVLITISLVGSPFCNFVCLSAILNNLFPSCLRPASVPTTPSVCPSIKITQFFLLILLCLIVRQL